MSLKNRKLVFYAFWTLLVVSPIVTVLRNTPLNSLSSNSILLTNFFQRIFGLTAFTLIFIQITLGSFMNKWIQIIGAKAYKFHITEGLLAYGFAFIHPLFENVIVYQTSKSITEALLVFVPSLETQRSILLVFGRVAFILATISVAAAYFRTKPFFRTNWRAFHVLNYLVFYLVYWHMRVGTDIVTPPFVWVSWIALASVTLSVVYRFLFPFIKKFSSKPAIEH